MQHPDEGTIHAWLDGELPPAEASTLEAHVKSCAECAAQVAEARGFIAASSRIVSALDGVPSAVVPSQAPSVVPAQAPAVVPAKAGTPTPAVVPAKAGTQFGGDSARPNLELVRGARPRRPFYRRPEFAAAAALLVVAVGTWNVYRTSGGAPRPASAPGAMQAPAAMPAMDSAVPFATTAPAAAGRAAAASPAPPAEAKRADAAPRDRRAAEADMAKSVAQPAPVVAADAPANARRELAANQVVGAVSTAAGAASQVARTDTMSAAKAADSVVSRRLAVSADAVTSAEKRRVADEVKAQRAMPAAAPPASRPTVALQEAVATGAAVSRSVPARRCFTIPRTPRAMELDVPEHFELIEVSGPAIGDRAWRQVRVPGESPEVGTWYWSNERQGALVLARIEGSVVRTRVQVTGVPAPEVRATTEGCVPQ